MPRVTFTQNLQRHVAIEPRDVEGATVREALDRVFAEVPDARGYVLDEQGALRKHMTIYVGGRLIRDRATLADEVPAGAEIHVFQALSGG